MDRLKARSDYVWALKRGARQLNDLKIGKRWFDLGVPVEQAIEWADTGHLPEEAAPLIAAGITPQMAKDGDDALVDEHGIIGAALLKLQMEDPDAEILVEPDVEEPQS